MQSGSKCYAHRISSISAVHTLCGLRDVSFDVVDDLTEVDAADKVFDEAVQQQRTDTNDNTELTYQLTYTLH